MRENIQCTERNDKGKEPGPVREGGRETKKKKKKMEGRKENFHVVSRPLYLALRIRFQ